jgi:hypothetical protein
MKWFLATSDVVVTGSTIVVVVTASRASWLVCVSCARSHPRSSAAAAADVSKCFVVRIMVSLKRWMCRDTERREEGVAPSW